MQATTSFDGFYSKHQQKNIYFIKVSGILSTDAHGSNDDPHDSGPPTTCKSLAV